MEKEICTEVTGKKTKKKFENIADRQVRSRGLCRSSSQRDRKAAGKKNGQTEKAQGGKRKTIEESGRGGGGDVRDGGTKRSTGYHRSWK